MSRSDLIESRRRRQNSAAQPRKGLNVEYLDTVVKSKSGDGQDAVTTLTVRRGGNDDGEITVPERILRASSGEEKTSVVSEGRRYTVLFRPAGTVEGAHNTGTQTHDALPSVSQFRDPQGEGDI